jgi:hypothetical protein
MDSPPTAGHFVNVNLEEYGVKASFAAKFAHHSLVMIRVVQHAHLLLHTLRHQCTEQSQVQTGMTMPHPTGREMKTPRR